MRFWVLAAAAVALNVADLVTTRAILNAGGREMNPFVNIYAHTPWFLVAKLVVIPVGIWAVAYYLRAKHPLAATVELSFLMVIFGAVVINNLTWLI